MDTSIVRVNLRGFGMTLASLNWLLKELQSHPDKKTVYVNFELPEWQRQTIEKYAVIKHVGIKETR